MSVQDLRAIGAGDSYGFLASVTQRNGAPTHYYADFKHDPDIDADTLQLRQFGSGAVVAGGTNIGGKVYAVVLPSGKGAGTLELRSMSDNVVRYSAKKLDTNIRGARSFAVKKGVWVLYRSGSDEESLEDLKATLAFASFDGAKPEMKLNVQRGAPYPHDAEILPIGDGSKVLIAWAEQQKTKTTSSLFLKINEVDGASKLSSPPKTIKIALQSEVESWRVTAFRGGLLLAVVDGDSLVGQAVLRVAYVDWSDGVASLKWVKDSPLINEHVSLPNWVVTRKDAHLLLPKWVEEDSTIATYTVGGDGIEKTSASGAFKKGTKVTDVFYDAKENDIYAIVRVKGQYGWQFDVCDLGDLD
jgi:hypothetical protein